METLNSSQKCSHIVVLHYSIKENFILMKTTSKELAKSQLYSQNTRWLYRWMLGIMQTIDTCMSTLTCVLYVGDYADNWYMYESFDLHTVWVYELCCDLSELILMWIGDHLHKYCWWKSIWCYLCWYSIQLCGTISMMCLALPLHSWLALNCEYFNALNLLCDDLSNREN